MSEGLNTGGVSIAPAPMAVFPFVGRSRIGGIGLLMLWVSVFDLSIAFGALVGGVVIDAVAVTAIFWLAGAFFLLTAYGCFGLRERDD